MLKDATQTEEVRKINILIHVHSFLFGFSSCTCMFSSGKILVLQSSGSEFEIRVSPGLLLFVFFPWSFSFLISFCISYNNKCEMKISLIYVTMANPCEYLYFFVSLSMYFDVFVLFFLLFLCNIRMLLHCWCVL